MQTNQNEPPTEAAAGAPPERAPARVGPPGHVVALPFLVFLAAIATLPTAAPATAQTPDTLRRDTVYEIEPIAVRAVRPSITVGGVSAVEVRLDSVRFQAAPLLEHVLRQLPLVQVRTNSRGEAQIALRGAEERQVAILLDGVPLTLGWDHRTDLSIVPLTAAQTVRLVRGMSSVLHGPNVLGGVVEIGMADEPITRPEPLTLAAGVDQHGGYSAGAMSGLAVDLDDASLVIRGGVGRRQHDGFPAPPDADAVYPSLRGDRLRVNSDMEHTDGFLSARYARGDAWIAASAMAFESERGVPPELSEQEPRLWRYPNASRFLGVVTAGTGFRENRFGEAQLRLNIGVDLGATEIRSYLPPGTPSDPGLDASAFFATTDGTEESDHRTVTVRVTGEQNVGPFQLRTAGTFAEIRHDETVTVGIASGSPDRYPAEYRQRLWSAGGELDLPFRIGSIGPFTGGRLSAGIALDGADTPGTGGPVEGPAMTEWGGRLGLSASTGIGGLVVHTAVSRRGRFPALREMYSTALGRFERNPDLRPELLTAVEAGFTSRFGRYDLQVVGFHQRLDHAIVRGAPPAGSTARYQRINRDRIRSTGLEVLAGYSRGRLTLESEFTIQDVKVIEPDSEGVRAEYEPELVAGIGGNLPLPVGLEVGAEVEYVASQYCAMPVPGQEEYQRLDGSARADVQLARAFRFDRGLASFQRVGLELAIDNLTDSTVYDQCGLPQPGRTFRLQLRLD